MYILAQYQMLVCLTGDKSLAAKIASFFGETRVNCTSWRSIRCSRVMGDKKLAAKIDSFFGETRVNCTSWRSIVHPGEEKAIRSVPLMPCYFSRVTDRMLSNG